MFTGIIEELGTVAAIEDAGGGKRFSINAPMAADDAKPGDSIAVNGVCLTVVSSAAEGLQFDVSPETLRVSTLDALREGSYVNVERAMTPSTRLGGHIVQGHVDGCGIFAGAEQHADFWTVKIEFPPGLAKYFVHKGSVAVDGISLTIAALGDSSFEIAVIPKTRALTNLSALRHGDRVNLEADIIAKYVERLMARG